MIAQGKNICFQSVVQHGYKFANGYINTLWSSSFYTTFYGDPEHVLHIRAYSAYIMATLKYGIIFMLFENVDILPAAVSRFGQVS
jgi:hypothetical protein